MATLIVIIVLVVLGVALVTLISLYRPGKTALKPGPGNQLPGQADFLIKPAPGFTIVNRTGGPPVNTGARGPVTTTFTFGEVTQNLTAICKLTGKQVSDCTCARCKGIKKEGKVS